MVYAIEMNEVRDQLSSSGKMMWWLRIIYLKTIKDGDVYECQWREISNWLYSHTVKVQELYQNCKSLPKGGFKHWP